MKKKGFYEYDPVIYPRRLYVVIGYDTKFLKNVFAYDGGRELEDIDDNSNGVTYFEVMRKDNKKIGELVVFPSKKEMTMNVISHESSHVCDGIEEALGISHGGEHSAYLMGWIASCVNKSRLGIGTYVELKAEENG